MKRSLMGIPVLAGVMMLLPLNVHAASRGGMGGMGGGQMGYGQTGLGGSVGFGGQTEMGSRGQMGWGRMGSDVDWACPNTCADNENTCRFAAQEQQRLCAEATCSQQTQNIQSACAGSPWSTACRQAQLAQRQCLQSCLQDGTTTMRDCSNEQLDCLQNCPPAADLSSKDPQCVTSCGATLTGCLDTADTTAQTCQTACAGLVTAAQQACQTDATGATCQQALRDAHACLEPCGSSLHQDRRACISAAQDCIAACPEATPVP